MAESPQGSQNLVSLLLDHKQDSDAFIDFAQKNHVQLKKSIEFTQDNFVPLHHLISNPPDAKTRAAFMAKLPDADSKALFAYMMDQPQRAKDLLDAIFVEAYPLKLEVEFIGKNAKELSQFVADHRSQLLKAGELATHSPNGAIPKTAVLTSPSLLLLAKDAIAFEKKHADDLGSIASATGAYKGAPPDPHQKERLQFLLGSLNELELFSRGMPGIEKGLGPDLIAWQKAEKERIDREMAYYKTHEKEIQAKRKAEQASENASQADQVHKLKTALAQLKTTAPDQYDTFINLERQAAELARHNVSGHDGRVSEWYKKDRQADPAQKLPLADPLELMIRDGMLAKVDDLLKHQSLPAKPAAKGQGR